MSHRDLDALYEYIPAVYRARDANLGQPLRGLMRLLAGELETIRSNIDALYDNWFVETCAPWVVPYLGELLAIEELSDQRMVFDFQRRWVGNTVAWRRRRGVAAVLQPAIFGATGWSARCEDAQRSLLATTNVRAVEPDAPGTADVRDVVAMAHVGTPFATAPISARLSGSSPSDTARRPGDSEGGGGIRGVTVWVWRLEAFPMEGMTPAAVTIEGQASSAGLYTMQPLGFDAPVFHAPPTAPPVDRVASPRELTIPLSVEELVLDLDAYQKKYQALSGLAAPANSVFYGPDRGLSLLFDGVRLGPGEVEGADLASWSRPSPGAWLWLSGVLSSPLSLPAQPQLLALFGDAAGATLDLQPPLMTVDEVAVSLQAALSQQEETLYSDALVVVVTDISNTAQQRLVITAGRRGASIEFEATDDDPMTVHDLCLTASEGAVGRGGSLSPALVEPVLPDNGLLAELEVVADALAPLSLSLQRPELTVDDVARALEVALRGLGPNGEVFAQASVLAVDRRLLVVPGPPPSGAGSSGITFLAPSVDPLTVRQLGLQSLVALDPERGRIALPVGFPEPRTMALDAPFGAVGPVGGGPYARPSVEATDAALDVDVVYQIGPAAEFTSIYDAYNLWLREGQPRAVLRILDSSTYRMDSVTALELPANGLLAIEAAVQQRPTLLLADPLRVVTPNEGGMFRLSGLMMSGRVQLAGNGAMAVRIEDSTLLPQRAKGVIFEPTGSLQKGRWAHTSNYLANEKRVLVVGGQNGSAALADCELYDPNAGTFADTGALLQARSHHTASEVSVPGAGQQIAILGGQDGSGQALASGELYDPVSGSFAAIAGSMGQGRCDHTATLVLSSGKILVAGGRDGAGQALASLEYYDSFNTTQPFETLTVTLSPPRWGHSASQLSNGTILLAGGENSNGPVSTLTVFDPRANTATNLSSSLIPGRTAAPALEVFGQNGMVISFFGGGAVIGTQPEALDMVSEWDQTPQSPVFNVAQLLQPRAGATASLMANGQVLVVAGEGSTSPGGALEPLSSGEVYSPQTRDSVPTAPLPEGRVEHTATTLPGGVILIVGGRGVGGAALALCVLTAEGPEIYKRADVLSAESDAGGFEVEIQRSLLGAVWLPASSGTVAIADSLLQPLARTIQGTSPPALAGSMDASAITGGYGPPATLERSTFLGSVFVSSPVEGTSIICQEGVRVADGVEGQAASGCLRYSYLRFGDDSGSVSRFPLTQLPDGIQVYRCQPDLALAQVAADLGYESVDDLPPAIAAAVRRRVRPVYTSTTYPDPAYGQLGLGCDPAITAGGGEGTEMGTFASVRQPQRQALLEVLTRRYLPLGQRASILYVN